MPSADLPPATSIAHDDMTGDQLALPTSERVSTQTRYGSVEGGRTKNGCQVFLNVPYGLDVPRWSDPQPLPPTHKYPSTPFVYDSKYCAQPERTYSQTNALRDRLGLGAPNENPFFADIYIPSDYPLSPRPEGTPLLPVKVFIHGGFLQYGSTSGHHYNQQFFPAEHYNEIRVLLGHRVSVLGFLGCEQPKISGNFGFKDCWLGLEWVRDNIESFGGDPAQVHLSGLSGGGHVVHQLVHQAARLAPAKAPFVTAHLQSNAILASPVSPATRNVQFDALCEAIGLDPKAPDVLEKLRDTTEFPTANLIKAVQSMGELCTFRGVIGNDGWVREDQVEFQHSGGLAKGLAAAGVKCIIAGDVRDEDFFYKGVHFSQTKAELVPNIARYYPYEQSERFLASYGEIPEGASVDEINTLLGRILADGQVHLPVRMLQTDLVKHSFPVVRYAIESVPKAYGTNGKASHGTDLAVHQLRLSMMTPEETVSALRFNQTLWDEVNKAVKGQDFQQKSDEEMLVLDKNGVTQWRQDWRWPSLRSAEKVFRA
ncbi:hypothetical protein I302_107240 [Kwoniella bestiolae CBS 10118]|uniref:Carboxylic ester hydrolase n=1 Tax=Kwoniella bestiolae CBS 10118 TaxID=1296100 RepID=A0A1B9FZ42_9TREE|nr:hypothetical protein I302_07025 [Kwoniella bestiolae CBS 10118]OCF24039.1 hypothetical protein I302_07025 [Kwoniella bestiolae CBS 10118]